LSVAKNDREEVGIPARYKRYKNKPALSDTVLTQRACTLTPMQNEAAVCHGGTCKWSANQESSMNFAFYVVFRESGMFLYASNVLSECLDFAKSHARVEIVDTFGQVWGMN
jgi:hypothetical protein